MLYSFNLELHSTVVYMFVVSQAGKTYFKISFYNQLDLYFKSEDFAKSLSIRGQKTVNCELPRNQVSFR